MTPHAIDPSKIAEFPDVLRNHWAYRYIIQLAGDDNYFHKTERVRVNNELKNERDVYGSPIYNNQ